MRQIIFSVVFFLFFTTINVVAQSSTNITLQWDWSYCFEFTWLGPEYNNVTRRYNGTCSDYLDEKRAKDVPCSPPIVISNDGTLPDMDYLWDNHRNSILCKRSSTQVCAKYVFKYNEKILNMTYMCTRAQEVGNGPIESGFYTQTYEGYDMEALICTSGKGIYRPCNSAVTDKIITNVFIFVVLLSFMFK